MAYGALGRYVRAVQDYNSIDRELPPDHAEMSDFRRTAPFRALCAKWGAAPVAIAHRYAMAKDGVDAAILGVKNRDELNQCLMAEELGPLEPARMAEIDALNLA